MSRSLNLRGYPVGIAVAPDQSRPTVDDEQTLGSLRITRRERHTDAATGVKRRDEHPLQAGVVQNGDQVVRLVFDAWWLARR